MYLARRGERGWTTKSVAQCKVALALGNLKDYGGTGPMVTVSPRAGWVRFGKFEVLAVNGWDRPQPEAPGC
jgi:hypothetical protein